LQYYKNLVVVVPKFYIDFLCFHLCSVGINITECELIMLLYYWLHFLLPKVKQVAELVNKTFFVWWRKRAINITFWFWY